MTKLICLSIILISQTVHCQNLYLKEGIYTNASEFLNNSPSRSLENFTIKDSYKHLAKNLVNYRTDWSDELNRKVKRYTGDIVKMPVKELFDSVTNKKVKRKDFWGFCDGSRVYINSRSHIKSWHYVPLRLRGKYSYFIQTGVPTYLGNNRHNNYYEIEEYVIDSTTGEIIRLTRTKLIRLIADNEKLSKDAKRNKYGNDNEWFIAQYNREHLLKKLNKQ